MSAPAAKADLIPPELQVRLGPRTEVASLLDHLVGAREQRGRQYKAECLRRLQVSDQFVSGGCLNWQIGWLLAFENSIDVAGCKSSLIDQIDSIGDQAAIVGVVAPVINGRQFVPGRKRCERLR